MNILLLAGGIWLIVFAALIAAYVYFDIKVQRLDAEIEAYKREHVFAEGDMP